MREHHERDQVSAATQTVVSQPALRWGHSCALLWPAGRLYMRSDTDRIRPDTSALPESGLSRALSFPASFLTRLSISEHAKPVNAAALRSTAR